MHRLGRLDGLAERRIVRRHVAPSEQRHAHTLDRLRVDVAVDLTPVRVARHEQRADSVFAGLGQFETELVCGLGEELVRNLNENSGAITGARISADRAAMFEVAKDRERVVDDLVRLAALDVGDEADAARILLERRIIKTLRLRRHNAFTFRAHRGHDSSPYIPNCRRRTNHARSARWRDGPRDKPPLWIVAALSLARPRASA